MSDTLKIAMGIFVGLALCVGVCCGGVLLFGAGLPPPEELLYPTPEPVEEEEISPLGTAWTIGGIEASVTEYQERDFLQCVGCWGSEEISPSEGAKFILLHVAIKNVGEVSSEVPLDGDFSLIYKDTYMESSWMRDSELDAHSTPCHFEIYPGVVCDYWRIYEVPKAADSKEMVVRLDYQGVPRTWGLGGR